MAYTTINNPELYFQTKAWTGTGNEIAITFDGSQNMQPDWVWLKKRSASGIHVAHDAVRGATKRLVPNSTDAETTQAQYVKSFDSNGITFGTDTDINANGATAILWGWKAGNSAGSANTDGTINSTVSVNTTAGFSIVKYTGGGSAGTVGHGLSAAPEVVILKSISGSDVWVTYHKGIDATAPADYFIQLQSTAARTNNADFFSDTLPTNQVFSIGANSAVSNNGSSFIAYCFAEKKGYSKFGTYAGNGNADGPFVYTGFKPAFIIIKNFEQNDSWRTYDNKRLGYNVDNNALFPNATDTEATSDDLDILSNGFKVRATTGGLNNSNASYIFMAFAENPLVANVGASGVPATAR